MKTLTPILGSLLLTCAARAAEPVMLFDPDSTPKLATPRGECAGTKCEHGIQDDLATGGPAVSDTQSLGIRCDAPSAGAQITEVGFLSEFWLVAGDVDIVIRDADTDEELSRTTVFVPAGDGQTFQFAVTPTQVQSACVVLSAVGNAVGTTGEDRTNGPFGGTFYSSGETCETEFLTENLAIWACWSEGPVSVDPSAWQALPWGRVKNGYRTGGAR